MIHAKKSREENHSESSWLSFILGWAFILIVGGGIVMTILHIKPERKLVCDDTLRRGAASLTQFGTCHKE